ncbi:MAG: 3-phosphoshikimate 1-carboxyvinyltransferase [Campylobacterales bacterium]|nr:3-phosphoshikimate 1-carboxyvinyltransferase [Campylobacterales bacterium]
MKVVTVSSTKGFNKEIKVPGDKSISHRVAMFSLLSNQKSTVTNFLEAEDTLNSLKIAHTLGAQVEWKNKVLEITPSKDGIEEPSEILDCGNAGTGIRLYTGLLASQRGQYILSGDKYLNSRPMGRVINPLNSIGAEITARDNNTKAPIVVRGSKLKNFNYESKIASAQVKTSLILAGLNGDGPSTITEPELSRDHTERMLKGMGADISIEDLKVTINPLTKPLEPLNINVASDPSSGFFFGVAAAITPNSKVVLKNLTLNPTRVEGFNVLKRMGVKVEFIEKENVYEPIGDIIVEYNELNAVTVDNKISWLIDEIPALSIAFALAKGTSVVKNAEELRVKESDRIKSVVNNLKLCGVKVVENEDGFEVTGSNSIKGATISSFGDHRIAMSFAIGGLVSKTKMTIEDTDCIDTSFPDFFEILKDVGGLVS